MWWRQEEIWLQWRYSWWCSNDGGGPSDGSGFDANDGGRDVNDSNGDNNNGVVEDKNDGGGTGVDGSSNADSGDDTDGYAKNDGREMLLVIKMMMMVVAVMLMIMKMMMLLEAIFCNSILLEFPLFWCKFSIFWFNKMYSSYKAVRWILKLIVIGYNKMFNAQN